MASFYSCVYGNSTVQMITSNFGEGRLGAIRDTINKDREAVKPLLEPQNTAYEIYMGLINQQISNGSGNGGIDKATGDANKAAALQGLAKAVPPTLATPDLTPIANVFKVAQKVSGMFGVNRDLKINDPL
jgi:hypothetical protein